MWTPLAEKPPEKAEELRVFGTAESIVGGRRKWLGKAIWNPEANTWKLTEGGGATDVQISYYAPLETEEVSDRTHQ